MLAAWQIYNNEYVAIRSGLQDKEREVNTIVLQQDTAESPKQHFDKAKVWTVAAFGNSEAVYFSELRSFT